MTAAEHKVAAVWVPASATDAVPAHVRRHLDGRPLDARCLHEEVRSRGRWVCVLAAGHDGRHG